MSLVLPTLLCLGLSLGQSTQAQNGNLPQPHITALPGPMVLHSNPVLILCQGPAEAEAYVISKVGNREPLERKNQLLRERINHLTIAEMTPDRSGLYHCSYQSGGSWSQFSDPLQLVITGAYDKPSLSSMTGTVVASGKNVKLQCFSTLKFDAFILIEEDEVHAIQNQSSTPKGGGLHAVFLLNHVSSTQARTYRCYGALRNYPYVWSHPSDPLQLQVREFPGGITTAPTMTGGKKELSVPHKNTSLGPAGQLGCRTMSLVLPTLLCLGESGREGPSYKYKATGGRAAGSRKLSCLTCCFLPGLYPGQCTQAQNRNLPRPDITAVPESMVLSKEPVSIQCQGPAEATAYAISKVGSPERSHTEKQLLSKTTNTLEIAQMTPDRAGLYHCSFQSGDSWSQFSDPLQLVMTGAYDKPSLSSMTGTVVASGKNVKLQCFSRLKFDAFILIEEDEVHAIQNQSSTPKGGGHQAVFLLNQVSPTQAGTYRCYGVFSRYPYVWSHASDPLQLPVRGEEAPVHTSSCPLLETDMVQVEQ
ncbi:PREDICTED: leukocyte immunoglobulin-like receptor subfamily A member 6 [Ceratotherium simum simum]|uniref:Leukocyte immunoglobulin-like receptor subfamily A member 6 n=1 Tax=Ceratotherium simum simum TaxID=73337 RepID=A0ABM1DD06_CERSS|nr:PREDICTED: leukocyte immunoglobulin-like receptor subfamily A member 6 [Ceratotherium simum simum]